MYGPANDGSVSISVRAGAHTLTAHRRLRGGTNLLMGRSVVYTVVSLHYHIVYMAYRVTEYVCVCTGKKGDFDM